jgi:hypothetical protein
MTESLRGVIGEELLFKTKKIFIRYFQRISLLPARAVYTIRRTRLLPELKSQECISWESDKGVNDHCSLHDN